MALAPIIPLKPSRKRRTRKAQPSQVALSKQELLAVLKAAKARSTRDWAMMLVAYRHGLRASEVCSLTFADVDLKGGAITIARLKGSLKTVQPLYEHRGEPLLDEAKVLKIYLKERPADGSNFVFVSQKGGQLDRTQFFRIFQAIAEDAGLPAEKRHPHVLKHSLATHLVGQNVNLAIVRQALGHQSIGSTMRYIGVTDSQASDAVRAAMMKLF